MTRSNTCPLCGSKLVITIGSLLGSRTKKKRPLFACIRCHTLFQSKLYQENDSALKNDLQWHIDKREGNSRHAQVIVKTLLEIQPDARSLLDIGCGIGTTLLAARSAGLDIAGIEPNHYACRYAKENYGIDIVEGNFCAAVTRKKYDLVVLDQVLEHVPDPRGFIADVFSILGYGGLLYLSFPGNEGGILRVMRSVKQQRDQRSIFFDNDVHINHFYHKGVIRICKQNDARIEKKVSPGTYIIRKKRASFLGISN